ncbi:hypothetical protein FACS1894208_02280 [Clostridia bacterium]|nr:hypothetical protein FACS1894208_02280 [Clostridia bacterium]
MSEMDLCSGAIDDFLDAPTATPELSKVEKDLENVCVVIEAQGDFRVFGRFVSTLSSLCAPDNVATDTRNIALRIDYPGRPSAVRLGFCDRLTADTLVASLFSRTGLEGKVYRNYGSPNGREQIVMVDKPRGFRF